MLWMKWRWIAKDRIKKGKLLNSEPAITLEESVQ
jgi:hypothetical protein